MHFYPPTTRWRLIVVCSIASLFGCCKYLWYIEHGTQCTTPHMYSPPLAVLSYTAYCWHIVVFIVVAMSMASQGRRRGNWYVRLGWLLCVCINFCYCWVIAKRWDDTFHLPPINGSNVSMIVYPSSYCCCRYADAANAINGTRTKDGTTRMVDCCMH